MCKTLEVLDIVSEIYSSIILFYYFIFRTLLCGKLVYERGTSARKVGMIEKFREVLRLLSCSNIILSTIAVFGEHMNLWLF